MQKFLIILILFVGVSAQAAEDMCKKSILNKAPMEQIAPSIIQADIEAGRSENEPLKAIQRFQDNNYYMKHPDLPSPKAISRCAPPSMYRQLSDETAKVVSSIFEQYKSNRWFLSENEFENPGLLQLLMLSNQYDAFLAEAEKFLLSAKDDSEAPQLFKHVHKLIYARQNHLMQVQKSLNNEYYSHGFGLLDIEKQGFEILSRAPAQIDALRQEHIDFLLDKENNVFSKVKNNPPPENAMVLFNPDAMESITYLERAIKVSLKEQQAPIRARAEMRGDDLVSDNRHREAISYFEVAMADEKLAKSQAIVESEANEIAEKTERDVEKQIEGMLKTEEERKEFESETDVLAEELGIDLDDF